MRAQRNDIRTVGYVLRRTNYGEADRILNLITPVGKLAVMARGVRKMKSKLAGGIEPFTRSDFQIHQGRSELGILTGAKMQKYYSHIVQDLGKMELAARILKRVDAAAETSRIGDETGENNGQNMRLAVGILKRTETSKVGDEAHKSDGGSGDEKRTQENSEQENDEKKMQNEGSAEEFFMLVDQSLAAIDAGENLELIEAWFLLNLKRIAGEGVNLYRDTDGKKLEADERYNWDSYERAFRAKGSGKFGVDEIKMLRLMVSNDLNIVRKIKYEPQILEPIDELVREL